MYNIAYEILIMIIPLVTMPYISRIIGASGYGTYSYHYSVACYFGLFGLLGISNYGVRSIATCYDDRKKRTHVFFSIYAIQLLASLLVIAAYAAYVLLFVKNNPSVAWLQLLYLLSVALDINWFYFGMELFSVTVIRNIVIKLATTGAIFLFVRKATDVALYTVIMVGGMLFSQIVLWLRLPHYINRPQIHLRDLREHISPVFLLFLPAIATSVFRCMDKIMLGALSGETQVGYYTQAENLIWACLSVITALGNVMIPVASRLSDSGDKKTLTHYTQISFRGITIFTIAVTGGLVGIAPVFIPFFLGSGFAPTIYITMLISPTMFFIAWENIIRTQYLLPNQKDMEFTLSVFAGALINLAANFALIPILQSYGAVIGSCLAECCVFIIQSMAARKEIHVLSILKSCLFYFVPGILMCILVLFLGTLPLETIPKLCLQFLSGVTVFAALTVPYLSKKDPLLWSILQSLLHRRAK